MEITSLNLAYNDLGLLDKDRWRVFCNVLQASHITSLNLINNNLEELDKDYWQVFCGALKASKITLLNLADNCLGSMHYQGMVVVMEENDHLQIERLFRDCPSELTALNERNCFLVQTCQMAQELINSKSKRDEKDYLAQIDRALIELNKSLSLLHGKDTVHANEMRAQLYDYQDDLKWTKGAWIHGQTLIPQDPPIDTQVALNRARETWLDISVQSKHYEEAHSQLFQLAYMDAFQESKANAQSAFIDALTYLLTEDNMLIILKIENQKIFDNYLFAAAGGEKGGLNIEFTPEQRLTLLQYVLLLEIKQSCEKKVDAATSNTQFFEGERSAGLRALLKDLSLDPNQLDEETQTKLDTLWINASERLEKISLTENMAALVAAINHLASSISQSAPSYQAKS